MHQKNLIIFISILFILCSGYLFWISDQGLKSDAGKNWWAVYFENPKDSSLNFTIENHSPQSEFHWVVMSDSQKIKEADVKIKTGETIVINPEIEIESGKVSIVVSSGSDKKEIYKNL